MRTTLPTRTIALTDGPEVSAAPPQPPPGGRRGRVSVEQRRGGGVALRVRAKLPPVRVVGHLMLLALALSFLLVAAAAVAIFSITWVRQDFDFADALDNLPRFAAGPPYVVLAASGVLLLLLIAAVAGACMVAYGLLLPRLELDVTPDGWLVRRRRERELWRVEVTKVQSVDYERAVVIVRTSDGTRKLRGWDDDMASLAASLRWALSVVTARAPGPEPVSEPEPKSAPETPVAVET